MSTATPKDVLDFWLSPESEPHWFRRSDGFDQKIREKFGPLLEEARGGALATWGNDPKARLARVIVLDQFSRNVFRGTPDAFAFDGMALQEAKALVADGTYAAMTDQERFFVVLPFMHSEALADQEACVALCKEAVRAGPEYAPAKFQLKFAIEHRDIVERFGRYPHRNAILGRASTPEELEFMKTHPGF